MDGHDPHAGKLDARAKRIGCGRRGHAGIDGRAVRAIGAAPVQDHILFVRTLHVATLVRQWRVIRRDDKVLLVGFDGFGAHRRKRRRRHSRDDGNCGDFLDVHFSL